jgi:two-component system LytT family response regulator
MDALTVLIVDDEPHARTALKGILMQNFPQVRIAGEAANVDDAVAEIRRVRPQLVFLDIEMPGRSGLELLSAFDPTEIDFAVVFVTAYNEYALRAFELSAIDYLLKPTRIEHVGRAIAKAMKLATLNRAALGVLRDQLNRRETDRIVLQVADGLLIKSLNELAFLKADSCYTHIHFTDGSKVTVSKTLQEYNGLEETGQFMRVNRSYIINLNEIERISKRDGGFIAMKNGEEISISTDKRNALQERFKGQIF